METLSVSHLCHIFAIAEKMIAELQHAFLCYDTMFSTLIVCSLTPDGIGDVDLNDTSTTDNYSAYYHAFER